MRSPLSGNEGKASRDQDAPSICLVSGRMSNAAGVMVMTMEAQFGVCVMALPGQNQVELEYRSRRTEELGGKHVF